MNATFYINETICQTQVSSRGIMEVCPFSSRVLRFLEKPSSEEETRSRNASVVFYCFRANTLPLIEK